MAAAGGDDGAASCAESSMGDTPAKRKMQFVN
jgi:hypothetical protein